LAAPHKLGESGNPRGRRPGTKLRITMLAEKLMQDDVPEVVRSAAAAAWGQSYWGR
jgi:hypothetical protein